MAWRHKSRSEKNLIRFIGFLLVSLLCFIIAVVAMNYAFKAKIKNLEDEIHDLKTDGTELTSSLTSSPSSTSTSSSSSSRSSSSKGPNTTTTGISTTTPLVTTSTSTAADTSSSMTTTSIEPTTSTKTSTEDSHYRAGDPVFDALRSLLTNFSGLTSSTGSIDKGSRKGNIVSRAHGTFIILADINHEESKFITPEPVVGSNELPEHEGTDSLFDDTEDDFETTTEDTSREGSGDGARDTAAPS